MYEKPTSTFAERLREAIDERDVSMAEVARKTNISTAAISRYLRGDYEPKQDKMYALSKYLMVNPAWLMGFNSGEGVGSKKVIFRSIAVSGVPAQEACLQEEIRKSPHTAMVQGLSHTAIPTSFPNIGV